MSSASSDTAAAHKPDLRPWGFWAILGGCAAFVLSQLVVGALFYEFVGESLSSAQKLYAYGLSSVVLLGVLGLILRRYHATFADLGLGRFRMSHFGRSLLAWPVYMVATWLCLAIVIILVPSFDPNQVQDLGFGNIDGFASLAAAFVALVIIPPFVEELLFRGFIFKGLLKHFKPVTAAVVTSLLFGAAHGQWNVGIDTFALSLVLCFLAYRSRSLWPALCLHGLKNLLAFVLVFVFTPSQIKDFLLRLREWL